MIVGLHTKLRPGTEEEYDRVHADVWPEVLAAIRRVGVERWHIFRDGTDVFHCIEVDDYDAAMAELAEDPVNRRWQAHVAPLMELAHDFSGRSRDRLPMIFDL